MVQERPHRSGNQKAWALAPSQPSQSLGFSRRWKNNEQLACSVCVIRWSVLSFREFVHLWSNHRCHWSILCFCINAAEWMLGFSNPHFLMEWTTQTINYMWSKRTHFKLNLTDREKTAPVPSPEMKWRNSKWKRVTKRRETPRAAAEAHVAAGDSCTNLGKPCTGPPAFPLQAIHRAWQLVYKASKEGLLAHIHSFA